MRGTGMPAAALPSCHHATHQRLAATRRGAIHKVGSAQHTLSQQRVCLQANAGHHSKPTPAADAQGPWQQQAGAGARQAGLAADTPTHAHLPRVQLSQAAARIPEPRLSILCTDGTRQVVGQRQVSIRQAAALIAIPPATQLVAAR
jgi:hypothetical protein